MVSPDIKRAIEIIDQRINSLQQIRKMLIDEFGLNNQNAPLAKVLSEQTESAPASTTRKGALINLLKSEGPLHRRDILTKTNFPVGTIAYLLNDKETFTHRRDGRWDLAKREE